MNSILFITAFKDINRKNWANAGRSNETYYQEFYNLASSIQYNLIVFISNNNLFELKNKFNFKDNITFYDIDEYYTFFQKYVISQKKIIESEIYKSLIPPGRMNNPEHWNAEYNLINHSKINYVSHAKKLFPTYKYYSWIDFGYIKENCIGPQNIDLQLLPKNKIIFQCINDIPSNRIHPKDMLSSDTIYFSGGAFIIPNQLIENFENCYEIKLIELENNGIVDDDQAILLQMYFDNPKLFVIMPNPKWFEFHNMLETR